MILEPLQSKRINNSRSTVIIFENARQDILTCLHTRNNKNCIINFSNAFFNIKNQDAIDNSPGAKVNAFNMRLKVTLLVVPIRISATSNTVSFQLKEAKNPFFFSSVSNNGLLSLLSAIVVLY